MDDNLDYMPASAGSRTYDVQRIKLTVKDLRDLLAWVDTVGVEKTAVVDITVSYSSGIGPSIEAKMETEKGQGVWKDLTDHGSW
jgi:hypothetical protein